MVVDPGNKEALGLKGVIYLKQHTYDQAIQYFDKALSVDPNYSVAGLGKQ